MAVDANPATRAGATGTEVYAREVARRLPGLAPELRFRFYSSRVGPDGIDCTVLPGRRLWSQLRLPAELWRDPPDAFFAPSHVVPFLSRGRALTVVHDLAFELHPEAYSRSERAYLQLTTRWAERRCRLLIVPSEATATDLSERLGVLRNRIRVIPLGGGETDATPDPEAARRTLEVLAVPSPFVLHVGRVEPKKNQLSALAAVEAMPDGPTLVSAGPIADRSMAARMAASPRCRVLGRVSPETIDALYETAEALVFPSLYEGFGLPVLEAMRRGLPVVTAAVSSLPEVGGEAALYVDDPRDSGALAEAIERAIGDRQRLASLGRTQAAKFTWDRTAAGVAGVLRELLA